MGNEKRLIDADKIYDAVERRYQVSSGIEHGCERDLLDLIYASETVDAVEVVHGRWIKTKEPLGWQEVDAVECSICHESWFSDEDDSFDYLEHWLYCPNCGAKMDKQKFD